MPHRLGNYFHRHNRDGTHDSICTGCYITIVTASEESHLPKIEDAHVCDPVRLSHIRKYTHYAVIALNLDFGKPQSGEVRQ